MFSKFITWFFGPTETLEEEQIRLGMLVKYKGEY